MSRIVQMRQRIKTIGTIKKITHAMRLISMSGHSRLRSLIPFIKFYHKKIFHLLDSIYSKNPALKSNLLLTQENQEPKELIILIGSQKGLCGNFNNNLFMYMEKQLKDSPKADMIAIGKKAVTFVESQPTYSVVGTYPTLSKLFYNSLAQEISKKIITATPSYTSVKIFSNVMKTFFIQQPKEFTLIPYNIEPEEEVRQEPLDYIFEQDPQEIVNDLLAQYLEGSIYRALLESQLAEQAARFISMDTAHRNALDLLATTKLQYNKLRQTKITKELTELSGSIEQR